MHRSVLSRACLAFLVSLFSVPAPAAQDFSTPYVFTLFAGTKSNGFADGARADARFSKAEGVTADAAGNVYVADTINHTIRKISVAGTVSTVAGLPGVPGTADGTGNAARFNQPGSIVVDASGNLYVADTGNHTIRKISPAGAVSTLAGSAGNRGSADGSGQTARFNFPRGVAIGPAGDLFVADYANQLVRKVTPVGVVTTIAGAAGMAGSADGNAAAARFSGPRGLWVDVAGTLFVADSVNQTIRKISGTGDVTTWVGTAGGGGAIDGVGAAARLGAPDGVVGDVAGNLYVVENGGQTIRKVTPAGATSMLAGEPGRLGFEDGAGAAAHFFNPRGLGIDGAGNLYVADTGSSTIRKVTAGGTVTTYAGISPFVLDGHVDGTGSSVRFSSPSGLAVDAAGNVYVSDYGNAVIRKITPAGVVSTFAGTAGQPGHADGTGSAARFSNPVGLALDASGNLYVAAPVGFRKVTPAGVVTTPVLSSEATDVEVDAAGNVYLLDRIAGGVRRFAPTGAVTAVAGLTGSVLPQLFGGGPDGNGAAATFYYPFGLAIDPAGTLYVADTAANTVRKVTSAGVVTTLAGQPYSLGWNDGVGTAAQLIEPFAIAADATGNLFVTTGAFVRKITPAGAVSTLGPTDVMPYAPFEHLRAIAVDATGTLYVADSQAVFKGVRAAAPTISGQPQNLRVSEGGAVQFTVMAAGAPQPNYQWYFNGAPFVGGTGSTLAFSNARSTDAGDYTVTVTNAFGTVTSARATLTVGGSSTPTTPGGGSSGGGSGGGGGGAPSFAFLLALLALAGLRRFRGKTSPSNQSSCTMV